MKNSKLNSGISEQAFTEVMPPARTLTFAEALDLSEATADSEARVIRDVVLIRAGMSANRRYYPEKVLQDATAIFEGAKAYADHPGRADAKNLPERSVRAITGWYANVRYQDGAIRADRVFANTEAGRDVWGLAEDIVTGRAPKTLAGLSINAVGKGSKKEYDDGEALEVEAITAAISVDDVTTPAAGGMYLAASAGDELTAGMLEALTFEEWREARPDYVKQLQTEWQVVRQTEAVKTAKAEADQLREALDSATKALNEAQAKLTEGETVEAGLLAEARRVADEATAALNQARRDLEIERSLRRVNLPADWEKSLRERLAEADPAKWDGILADELTKAKHVAKPKPARVGGAEPQVMPAVNMAALPDPSSDVRPRDGEDVAAWQRRTSRR